LFALEVHRPVSDTRAGYEERTCVDWISGLQLYSCIQQCLSALQIKPERHVSETFRANGLSDATGITVLGQEHEKSTAACSNQLPAKRPIRSCHLVDPIDPGVADL
jgi:hypothetical protein